MTTGRLALLAGVIAFLAVACGKKKDSAADEKTAADKKKAAARTAALAEAGPNLRKIFDGARAAFEMGATVSRDGKLRKQQFPASTPLTPATPCCKQPGGKCRNTDWSHPTWTKVTFEISDPHDFQYQLISSGTGRDARLIVRAVADPDCDGRFTVVECRGRVGAQLRVVGATAQRVRHNVTPPF